MAPSEPTAALRFLTDAGHLLATSAPETSAYLMSRRNDLMFAHEIPQSDRQRQHVCSCCGHIMLYGQGSSLEINPGKKANRVSRSARRWKGSDAKTLRPEPRSGPTKIMTCGHCGRQTKLTLPPPAPISRRKARGQTGPRVSGPGEASSVSSNTPKETLMPRASANASSKKRAKSRKAGLQALLNQSNAARNSMPGLGLSLADFMDKK